MSIQKSFEAIGAIARVTERENSRFGNNDVTINIGHDEKGQEFFDVRMVRNSSSQIAVVDRKPDDRHLLMMVKTNRNFGEVVKTKYLCGHDEFHWFVAAVDPDVADVDRAKESLKPGIVREAQSNKGGRKKVKGGVKRQGEWFFLPKNHMKVVHNQILRNEPIQRGRNKPHMVEELWRTGGKDIVVATINTWEKLKQSDFPAKWFAGISLGEYTSLTRKNTPEGELAKKCRWRQGRVDATVFGRGKVTHPDHSTLVLKVWHQIVPNTEARFVDSDQLRFID